MEDKRIDKIQKLEELKQKLKYYEDDLEATEIALQDVTIDYYRKKELQEDVLYDKKEIMNYKKLIKAHEMGKSIN